MYALKKFTIDLARGKIGEKEADRQMAKRGFIGYPNDTKSYDRYYSKGTIRFLAEIKYDELSEKTGNICLELRALRHSKASILIIVLPENGNLTSYMCPLKDALSLAESWPIKRQTGDFKDNISALVKKDDFIRLLKPQRL